MPLCGGVDIATGLTFSRIFFPQTKPFWKKYPKIVLDEKGLKNQTKEF